MVINQQKSNYMVISRSNQDIATRLNINGELLDRKHSIVHLGMHITDRLCGEKHISEICRKAYPRVKLLSKLKYGGVHTEDLITIYSLHIRSVTEYCSTTFHSSLSQRLSNKLEAIQKTCLWVILGEMFIDYNSALEMCALKSLYKRREDRSLSFAIKCTKHETNKSMFPLNPSQDTHTVRHREKYLVNKSHTAKYMKSTIPYLQRRLNSYTEKLKEVRARSARAGRRQGL